MNHWISVIQEIKDLLVKIIIIIDNEVISEGSGVLCSEDGTILTANHVYMNIQKTVLS